MWPGEERGGVGKVNMKFPKRFDQHCNFCLSLFLIHPSLFSF